MTTKSPRSPFSQHKGLLLILGAGGLTTAIAVAAPGLGLLAMSTCSGGVAPSLLAPPPLAGRLGASLDNMPFWAPLLGLLVPWERTASSERPGMATAAPGDASPPASTPCDPMPTASPAASSAESPPSAPASPRHAVEATGLTRPRLERSSNTLNLPRAHTDGE